MGRWVVVAAVAGLALASDCSGVWAENAPSGERGRLASPHCYLHPLDCADPAALTCEEGCDVAFDACVGRSGEAGRSGRCQVDVVRGKRACAKEAPPSSDTAAAPRSPLACRERRRPTGCGVSSTRPAQESVRPPPAAAWATASRSTRPAAGQRRVGAATSFPLRSGAAVGHVVTTPAIVTRKLLYPRMNQA